MNGAEMVKLRVSGYSDDVVCVEWDRVTYESDAGTLVCVEHADASGRRAGVRLCLRYGIPVEASRESEEEGVWGVEVSRLAEGVPLLCEPVIGPSDRLYAIDAVLMVPVGTQLTVLPPRRGKRTWTL